jgi:hypothetical protein
MGLERWVGQLYLSFEGVLKMMKRVCLSFLLVIICASIASPWGGAPVLASAGTETSLMLLRSDAGGVLLAMDVSLDNLAIAPAAVAGYQQLSVPGMDHTSQAGSPQMPVRNVLIGVPPQAEVSLRVLSDTAEVLPGFFQVAPAPYPFQIEGDLQPPDWMTKTDPQVYRQDALYPDTAAQLASDAWLRDMRIVRLELYPLQFNPALGQLVWHRQLQVEIRFTYPEVDAPLADVVDDPLFDSVLADQVINFDIARAWRQIPHQAIKQALPSLQGSGCKITLDHDGIYRLTYNDLEACPNELAADPTTFRLTNQGEDVAINVAGEADGQFDVGDTLTFYGQAFQGDHMAAKYADENSEWVTYTQQLTNGVYVPWHPSFDATMV